MSASESLMRYSGAQLPVSILITKTVIASLVLRTMDTCWVFKCLGKPDDLSIKCSFNCYP